MLFVAHKALGHLIAACGSLGAFAVVDFGQNLQAGSILIAVILVALAGAFTVRSKIAEVWRQEAEGEKVRAERLEKELADEKTGRLVFEQEQQELRHDLKNEIAGLKAQLAVADAKPDLTTMHELLREIADKLPDEPITKNDQPIDVHPVDHAEE